MTSELEVSGVGQILSDWSLSSLPNSREEIQASTLERVAVGDTGGMRWGQAWHRAYFNVLTSFYMVGRSDD